VHAAHRLKVIPCQNSRCSAHPRHPEPHDAPRARPAVRSAVLPARRASGRVRGPARVTRSRPSSKSHLGSEPSRLPIALEDVLRCRAAECPHRRRQDYWRSSEGALHDRRRQQRWRSTYAKAAGAPQFGTASLHALPARDSDVVLVDSTFNDGQPRATTYCTRPRRARVEGPSRRLIRPDGACVPRLGRDRSSPATKVGVQVTRARRRHSRALYGFTPSLSPRTQSAEGDHVRRSARSATSRHQQGHQARTTWNRPPPEHSRAGGMRARGQGGGGAHLGW